jgi:hypothetical protein
MKIADLGTTLTWTEDGPADVHTWRFDVTVNGVPYVFHHLGIDAKEAARGLVTNLEQLRNELLVNFGTDEGKAN